MSEPTRRTRPIAERTEPNRSWTQGFETARADDEVSRETGNGSAEAARPSNGARESAYNTVNNAYRLIDEYLRQGQRMAMSAWLPSQGASGGKEDLLNAPARLLRAMGDMTMAWFEVLQQTTGAAQGRADQGPIGTAGPFSAGKGAANSAAPDANPPDAQAPTSAHAIKVIVQSSGRVSVSVELTCRVELRQLIATELRCSSNDADPVQGIEIEASPADAAPILKILVPEGQPRGTYNGLLLERETQRPCGMISLSVL